MISTYAISCKKSCLSKQDLKYLEKVGFLGFNCIDIRATETTGQYFMHLHIPELI